MSRWKLKIIICKICNNKFFTYLLKTGVCKKCQKDRTNRKYRIKNRERLCAYSRNYRKEHKKQCAKRDKEYRKSHLTYLKERARIKYRLISKRPRKELHLKTWTTKHTTNIKLKARLLVQRAVKKGYLKKPNICSKCKKIYKKKYIEGHHRNYKLWWKVIWLCKLCHCKLHFRKREKVER